MARVTVGFGIGNSAERQVGHTDDIRRDRALYQFLGTSPDNTELTKNGQPYNGPLHDGDSIEIVTRANRKA